MSAQLSETPWQQGPFNRGTRSPRRRPGPHPAIRARRSRQPPLAAGPAPAAAPAAACPRQRPFRRSSRTRRRVRAIRAAGSPRSPARAGGLAASPHPGPATRPTTTRLARPSREARRPASPCPFAHFWTPTAIASALPPSPAARPPQRRLLGRSRSRHRRSSLTPPTPGCPCRRPAGGTHKQHRLQAQDGPPRYYCGGGGGGGGGGGETQGLRAVAADGGHAAWLAARGAAGAAVAHCLSYFLRLSALASSASRCRVVRLPRAGRMHDAAAASRIPGRKCPSDAGGGGCCDD